ISACAAAKEGAAIRRIQRRPGAQPLDEIGVRNVKPPESDQVSKIVSPCCVGQFQVVAVVGDVEARELPPQQERVECTWGFTHALRYALNHVQVSEPERVELLDHVAVGPQGVAVQSRVVDGADRGEANSYSLGAASSRDSLHDFEQ